MHHATLLTQQPSQGTANGKCGHQGCRVQVAEAQQLHMGGSMDKWLVWHDMARNGTM